MIVGLGIGLKCPFERKVVGGDKNLPKLVMLSSKINKPCYFDVNIKTTGIIAWIKVGEVING